MLHLRVIIIVSVLLIIAASTGFGQPGLIESSWLINYGSTGWDEGRGVVEDDYGNFIQCGVTYNYSISSYDAYLTKTSSLGDSIWSQRFTALTVDRGFFAVDQCDDGGYIISGTTGDSPDIDLTVTRTDADGYVEWSNFYGERGWYVPYTIQQITGGDYVVYGGEHTLGPDTDMFMMKMLNSGELNWDQYYHNSSCEIVFKGLEAPEGGFYLIGNTNTSPGAGRGYVIKTDEDGNVVWENEFFDNMGVEFLSGCLTSDGGVVAAGYTYGEFDTSVLFMAKMDQTGNVLWEKTHWDCGMICKEIIEDHDGGLTGINDCFHFFKTDRHGRLIFDTQWERPGFTDRAVEMILADDGDLVVSGRSSGGSGFDLTMAKFNNFETVITVELPDTSLQNGESVWVPVTCSNIIASDSVLSYQVFIEYDETFGYFDSVMVENCLTPEFYIPVWNFEQPGMVTGGYLNFSTMEPITGEGILCYIRFTAEAEENGEMEMDFTDCVFNGGTPISSKYNGAINIYTDELSVSPDSEIEIIRKFSLSNPYPNPFNINAVVAFFIPDEGFVSLEVFDTNGRLVKTIFSGMTSAGEYTEQIEFDKTAAGLYFIRLKSGSYQEVKKLILIK